VTVKGRFDCIFNSCRDALILAAVDAGTCILAGFAIFSILGYLALSQGKDVEDVVKEGQSVHVIVS
jgi:solute carrier family 6 GABA transporter-like protein 6/8/11/12/13